MIYSIFRLRTTSPNRSFPQFSSSSLFPIHSKKIAREFYRKFMDKVQIITSPICIAIANVNRSVPNPNAVVRNRWSQCMQHHPMVLKHLLQQVWAVSTATSAASITSLYPNADACGNVYINQSGIVCGEPRPQVYRNKGHFPLVEHINKILFFKKGINISTVLEYIKEAAQISIFTSWLSVGKTGDYDRSFPPVRKYALVCLLRNMQLESVNTNRFRSKQQFHVV